MDEIGLLLLLPLRFLLKICSLWHISTKRINVAREFCERVSINVYQSVDFRLSLPRFTPQGLRGQSRPGADVEYNSNNICQKLATRMRNQTCVAIVALHSP